MLAFKSYFKTFIIDLKRIYDETDNSANFFVWNGLLLDLLPADDLLPPVQNAVQRDEV